MASKDVDLVKEDFESGKYPTGPQFTDLVDTTRDLTQPYDPNNDKAYKLSSDYVSMADESGKDLTEKINEIDQSVNDLTASDIDTSQTGENVQEKLDSLDTDIATTNSTVSNLSASDIATTQTGENVQEKLDSLDVDIANANINWDSGKTYSENQIVDYQGQVYTSLVDSNLNNIPSNDSSSWRNTDKTFIGSYNPATVAGYKFGQEATGDDQVDISQQIVPFVGTNDRLNLSIDSYEWTSDTGVGFFKGYSGLFSSEATDLVVFFPVGGTWGSTLEDYLDAPKGYYTISFPGANGTSIRFWYDREKCFEKLGTGSNSKNVYVDQAGNIWMGDFGLDELVSAPSYEDLMYKKASNIQLHDSNNADFDPSGTLLFTNVSQETFLEIGNNTLEPLRYEAQSTTVGSVTNWRSSNNWGTNFKYQQGIKFTTPSVWNNFASVPTGFYEFTLKFSGLINDIEGTRFKVWYDKDRISRAFGGTSDEIHIDDLGQIWRGDPSNGGEYICGPYDASYQAFNNSNVALREKSSGIQELFESIPTGSGGTSSVTGLTENRVVWYDNSLLVLRMYEHNGSGWTQIGSDTAIAGGGEGWLATLTENRIAFIDKNNSDLRCYEFNGTTFDLVGSELPIGNPGTNIALTSLSNNRVVYYDTTDDDILVYEFDEANWNVVGNPFSLLSSAGFDMTSLSSNSILIVDNSTNDLRKYDFDGADWTLDTQNDTGVNLSGRISLTTLSPTRVILTANNTVTFMVFDFDSDTGWTRNFNYHFEPNDRDSPDITTLTSNTFAYTDVNSNEYLRLYQIDTEQDDFGGVAVSKSFTIEYVNWKRLSNGNYSFTWDLKNDIDVNKSFLLAKDVNGSMVFPSTLQIVDSKTVYVESSTSTKMDIGIISQ